MSNRFGVGEVRNLDGPFSSKSHEIILNELAWALIWAVSTC